MQHRQIAEKNNSVSAKMLISDVYKTTILNNDS